MVHRLVYGRCSGSFFFAESSSLTIFNLRTEYKNASPLTVGEVRFFFSSMGYDLLGDYCDVVVLV